MHRTLHALIRSARDDAETLRHYRIMRAEHGFILWRYKAGWMAVHHFPSREAAEEHLARRLTQDGPEGPRRMG